MRIPAVFLAVLASGLLALPAGADQAADPVLTELDAYWAEVSRTVAEGDFEGMRATYHPDAIWVTGDANSYRTVLMTEPLKQVAIDTAATREGVMRPNVEFRFSERVHDADTAREVGISHYWVTRTGQPRQDVYGHFDTYLVKKSGRWMALVEIQRGDATKADWDALR